MTDALLKSGLRMPSSFVEVKDDEMEYVAGGMDGWHLTILIIGTILCGVSVPLFCAGIAPGFAALFGGIALICAAFGV